MSSESFIRLPPDGTGKKTRALHRTDMDVYESIYVTKNIEVVNPFYAATLVTSPLTGNMHHMSIWNGSSMYLRIHAIILEAHYDRVRTTKNIQFIVQRISSISDGTDLPITRLDNRSPAIPDTVLARYNATVTLKEAPIVLLTIHNSSDGGNTFVYFKPVSAIVIAPNEGITIQQSEITDDGNIGIVVYFSTEVIEI